MDKTTKALLAAAVVTGGLFLIFRRASSSAPTSPSQIMKNVNRYHDLFWKYAVVYRYDPAIVSAIAAVESGGKFNAMGAAGEIGLMQIMPGTWRQYCEGIILQDSQLLQPEHAIRCATSMLKGFKDKYGFNPAQIAAYNCGTGNVVDEGYDPIDGHIYTVPESTYRYVEKVLGYAEQFRNYFRGMYPQGIYDKFYPNELTIEDMNGLRGRGMSGLGFLQASRLSGLGGVAKKMTTIQKVPIIGQILPQPLYVRRPRWGLQYNQVRYRAGFDPPGACPVPPRGLGLRRGTRWLYR